ncbi:hypothetical protein Pmani_002090 [Petrolisthes manimaculis]|uniref:Uncharacterized protein n=1 Tax=Petrolisthes manimaculis TaxID=1843537 RepID=A0AAE1UNS3_9EUCA|nr:hypothetical protein Pmani_002090 [Petrolisthes manimaculis]
MREVLSSGEKDLTVEEILQEMEREDVSESEGEKEMVPRRMNHKDVARVLEQAEILKSLIIEINPVITEGSSEANEVDKLPVIRKYRDIQKTHQPQTPTQHHLLLQAREKLVVDIVELSGDGSGPSSASCSRPTTDAATSLFNNSSSDSSFNGFD